MTLLKDLLATAALFGVFLLGCAAVTALLEWRP